MTDILDEILDVPLPSIPLEVLRAVYAPLILTGEFTTRWLNEVSKNIFLEVNVINPDGSIVMVVPSLAVPFPTTRNTGITDVLNMVAIEQIHIKKENQLRTELPKVLKFVAGRTSDIIARWNAVMKLAGLDIQIMQDVTSPIVNNLGIVRKDDW